MLFLFEKPGPMTIVSGFISRINDDPTAEATFEFVRQAGIPRRLTVIWNVVPWWNGSRKVTGAELRDDATCVEQLIGLMPQRRAVVMVGEKAARARRFLKTTGLPLFASAHPSPLVRATLREWWAAIPSEWAKGRSVLDPTR